MAPIRVLVVDDSSLMRGLITSLLGDDPDIQVIGTAADAKIARRKIRELNPDVITLDVEMPGMDGLSFLEKIMSLRPTPVVMISGYTQEDSEAALNALEIGAVDFVAKSSVNIDTSLHEKSPEIVSKVKAAAIANLRHGGRWLGRSRTVPTKINNNYVSGRKLVCIGASAGGVEAISYLVRQLPATSPAILLAQHMPKEFTERFAMRLDSFASIRVVEAKNNAQIDPGCMYIAPGDRHLKVAKSAGGYICVLEDSPLVSGHRPSVDVLFSSAAKSLKERAVGLILTGMGKDGASGLLKLRNAGAMTFGQDEDTSMIYGMPKKAFDCGAVQKQVPLSEISAAILNACRKK